MQAAEMQGWESKRDELLATLVAMERCVIAYSGGVDSAVVAAAAFRALGASAIAVTGVSDSLASGELEIATRIAEQIGIRHRVIATDEMTKPGYLRNGPDRCYHCKSELYSHLGEVARAENATMVNGANLDDVGDYRPGMKAAGEFAVRSPLLECRMTKSDVRALAQHWGLPVWDKPATPCLSSRIAYGEEVTPERLRMIDHAEAYLRSKGLENVRVRYHRGDLARLEISPAAIGALAEDRTRREISAKLRELGFRFVTLDLDGFRSGSLNDLVSLG